MSIRPDRVHRGHRVAKTCLRYLVLTIALLASLAPILWLISTSFKKPVEAFAIPPVWIFKPRLTNYIRVLQDSTFIRYYLNSLVIGLATTALGLLVGVPAAYSLARFSFKRKGDINFWILSTRMGPPVGLAIPFYIIVRKLGLLDSYAAMIPIHLTFVLSFVVWMMRGFFFSVPAELEEAAIIDGCSQTGAFLKITLPLTAPGLAATAIFSFLMSWNEFLFAMVLTEFSARTVPVGIQTYISWETIRWGEISAAGILALIPVLLFTIAVQKYLIRGLTMGAIR